MKSRKASRTDDGTVDEVTEGKLRLRHIGQSFSLSQNLWVRTSPDALAKTQLPQNYDPNTRFNADTTNPAFDAVEHELHSTIYELKAHLKPEEQHYRSSVVSLRRVSGHITRAVQY